MRVVLWVNLQFLVWLLNSICTLDLYVRILNPYVKQLIFSFRLQRFWLKSVLLIFILWLWNVGECSVGFEHKIVCSSEVAITAPG